MSTLTLHDVVPAPIRGRISADSDVWGTTLEIQRGEACQVVAPSGRGKSTLMHVLYGLRTDYSGTVRIDGDDVAEFDRNTWADVRQRRIAIVFQDLGLFLHLTGAENIRVKTALRSSVTDDDVGAMCDRLGIAGILDQPCAHMSYGERQRVAIARALTQPFEWLLLDEPFSHLDPANIALACELVREACETRGAGCLVASLDADDRLAYDRKVRL